MRPDRRRLVPLVALSLVCGLLLGTGPMSIGAGAVAAAKPRPTPSSASIRLDEVR